MGFSICHKLFLLSLFALFCQIGQAQIIISENFDSGIPTSWSIVDGGTTTDTWFGTTLGYQGNYLDSTEFAFVDSDAAGATTGLTLSEHLVSPAFNSLPYGQIVLEFDQYFRVYSQDSGFVEVYDGSNWITVLALGANNGSWGNPDHRMINLTLYKNANMKVRFRYEDYAIWAWFWAIDNVKIWSPLPIDLLANGFVAPQPACGLGSAEDVLFQVLNNGIDTLSSFSLHYRLNNGPVNSENVNIQLLPGQKYTHVFTAKANLSASGNHIIDGWCSVNGDGKLSNDSTMGHIVLNLPVISTFPYLENFESGTGNWFATGINSTWAHGNPAKTVIQGAASGSNAWVTGGLGTGSYLNNENSAVNSPCFDFSGLTNPWMKMAIWWENEADWDGAVLQSSTDFGNSWQLVGAFADTNNWYNNAQVNALGSAGWSGWNQTQSGSGGWLQALHRLDGLTGKPNVRFRLAFGSDGSIISEGFAFDDVLIADGPKLELGTDTSACDSLFLAGPNVSRWLWSTGDTTSGIWVSGPSQLIGLSVTDSFGFKAEDSLWVNLVATGSLDLGPDSTYCAGEFAVIDGGSGAQAWNWSNGDTTQVIGVSVSGTYSVVADFAGACLRMDTIDLIFNDFQTGFILPGDSVCKNQPLVFTDTSQGAVAWQWDFGDGNFSNLANPTHTYISGGTYLVSISNNDGICFGSAIQAIFVKNCLFLPSSPQSTLLVWPNPSQGIFSLGIPAHCGEGSFKLHDLEGRKVHLNVEKKGSATYKLEATGLAQGSYILSMQSLCHPKTVLISIF